MGSEPTAARLLVAIFLIFNLNCIEQDIYYVPHAENSKTFFEVLRFWLCASSNKGETPGAWGSNGGTLPILRKFLINTQSPSV